MYNISIIDRFNLKTIISENKNDCWIWTGSKYRNGYGYMQINYRRESVHRVSYTIYKGMIPDGLCVCHTCDNRLCVNPEHLFLGTYQDNENDKVSKGRQAKGSKNGLAGTKHWNSKLDEEKVRKIRELYASGKYLQREIGEMFGIRDSLVSRIVTRARWAWLDE